MAPMHAFGVANTLAHPGMKWLFVGTNIPYFFAAALVFTGSPLPDAFIEFVQPVCALSGFFGCQILLTGAISTYWHGAQCQLQLPPGLRWLYGYTEEHGFRMQSVAWLKYIFVADIACASVTVLLGMGCFGALRTLSWLAFPILTFVFGALAKRQHAYGAYVILHGLWHLLSALAIPAIVLDDKLPPWFTVLTPSR